MAKPKEVIRIFKISDAESVQTSRQFYNQFQKDKDKFIELDPDFGGNFSTNWLSAIEEAETFVGDSTVKSDITILTENVRNKMEIGRTHFQKMKYYIEKAFPNNQAVWNSFGYGKYDSARNSEVRFIPFLRNLHTKAVKYADKLIAANYTQAGIDRIDTIREEISEANQVQENYKGDRPVVSQERIELLNKVWEFLLKVNKASKNVFADDYAKLKQYLRPDEAGYEVKEAKTPS
jgi:hypothetical protein